MTLCVTLPFCPSSVLACSCWPDASALQLAALASFSQRPASSSTGIRLLVAVGGVVYASHDEVTVALDGGSGHKLWSAAGAAQLVG